MITHGQRPSLLLKEFLRKISVELHRVAKLDIKSNEAKITEELKSIQGTAMNIDGYYAPKSKKAQEAMRPSPSLNAIIEAI